MNIFIGIAMTPYVYRIWKKGISSFHSLHYLYDETVMNSDWFLSAQDLYNFITDFYKGLLKFCLDVRSIFNTADMFLFQLLVLKRIYIDS